jgi:hypothetical protein
MIFQEAVSSEQVKSLTRQAVVEMQGAILLRIIYSDILQKRNNEL